MNPQLCKSMVNGDSTTNLKYVIAGKFFYCEGIPSNILGGYDCKITCRKISLSEH